MTKRIRVFVRWLGAAALVSQVLAFQACGGGGNTPATKGSGGATGTASGGASGTATGGASGTASGGSTGAGSGGSTGTGGGAFGEPACLSTVSKGSACGPTDQQLCYKTCGPEKTGVKSETCQTSGTYAEMSGCTFDPAQNYACYKIPTTANTACPTGTTPQGSATCDVPHCTLCNSMQGLAGGQYLDSSGSPKTGWCTCQEANTAGTRTWTCASDTAWPCPSGQGC
jgi:hypothetical protein